jgi:ABC-type transporter MlaC component
MKKILTTIAMVVALMGAGEAAYAQMPSPQEMAMNQLNRMSSELKLTKEQENKIEPFIVARIEKMMEFRQAGMEREEMMGEMKKINDGQQEALKAILTPEQLEKYKTMQSQMRAGGPPRN